MAVLRAQVAQLSASLPQKTQCESKLQAELIALRAEKEHMNETLSLFMQHDAQLRPEVLRRKHAKVQHRTELEHTGQEVRLGWRHFWA